MGRLLRQSEGKGARRADCVGCCPLRAGLRADLAPSLRAPSPAAFFVAAPLLPSPIPSITPTLPVLAPAGPLHCLSLSRFKRLRFARSLSLCPKGGMGHRARSSLSPHPCLLLPPVPSTTLPTARPGPPPPPPGSSLRRRTAVAPLLLLLLILLLKTTIRAKRAGARGGGVGGWANERKHGARERGGRTRAFSPVGGGASASAAAASAAAAAAAAASAFCAVGDARVGPAACVSRGGGGGAKRSPARGGGGAPASSSARPRPPPPGPPAAQPPPPPPPSSGSVGRRRFGLRFSFQTHTTDTAAQRGGAAQQRAAAWRMAHGAPSGSSGPASTAGGRAGKAGRREGGRASDEGQRSPRACAAGRGAPARPGR